MDALEQAWIFLKMTPDEMRQQGFGAAAEQMEEMKQQEQQAIQQGQATAPRPTAQTESYQQQLDAMKAKQEQIRRIRALIKQGRRVNDVRNAVEEFYLQHGDFPPVNKKYRRRLAEYSRRGGN